MGVSSKKDPVSNDRVYKLCTSSFKNQTSTELFSEGRITALCRWPDHYPPITNHVRRIYIWRVSKRPIRFFLRIEKYGDKVQVFLEYEWIIHKQNKNEMNTKTKRSGA